MFDLAGRIVLQDAFSTALEQLTNKSHQVEGALNELGEQADQALVPVRQRITELTREVERLRVKARSGQPITLVDLAQFRNASSELRSLTDDMQVLQGASAATGSTLELLGKISLMTGSAFTALRTAGMVVDLTRLGAAAQTQATILENLGRANQINTRQLVVGLREASRGVLDNTTIMTTANRALLAGGAQLAQELPRLFEIARAASLATGSDIAYVYETLIKGIIRASPLLIDNADIYIKVSQAVDEYAAAVGKTTDSLSVQERQMAILNAVLTQGGRFIRQMGLDSETAADQMQSLPTAINDVKQALGELLVEAGVPRLFSNLAKSISAANDMQQLQRQAEALSETLGALGDVAALEDYRQTLAELTATYAATGSSREGLLAYNAGLQELIDRLATRKTILLEQRDPEAAFLIGLRESEAAFKAAGAAAAENTERLKLYGDALKSVTDKATSVTVLTEQLGQLAGLLQTVQTDVPEMPKVESLLGTDVSTLRAYLDGVARLNPALTPVIATAARSVEAFATQQQAVLASARAMNDHAAALAMIARAALGVGATVDDLVSKFDTLPPSVQQAVLDLGLLETALSRVQDQADRPITIDVQVSGLSNALAEIDRLALRLVGVLDPDQIRAFRDQARAEVAAHWRSMEGLDRFGMELQKSIILKGYDDIVSGTLQHYQALETATRRHHTNLADSAQELRSRIEGVLKQGLEVTPEQMLAAQTGTYRDVALESARRLQAIAERGFAEIKAHPDWATALKIPEDVLNGSEAGLKAWAARMKGEVTDLARPDLINWDAFIAQFKQQLDREAAQKLTIDIAVEKLNAAGLLSGLSEQEQKKKVAQMLGIAAPELTIDALFEPQGTAADLVKKFLGDREAAEIPARFVFPAGPTAWIPEYNELVPTGPRANVSPPTVPTSKTGNAQYGGAGRAEQLLSEVGATGINVMPAVTFDWSQTALQAAQNLATGLQTALQDSDVALQAITQLSVDFAKNHEAWKAIGIGAGKVIGETMQTAIIDNVGDVRVRIAELLAPEVATILQRRGAGRNSIP